MRPKQINMAVLTDDDNGICVSQTPAAGGVQSLTLNGALVSGGIASTTNGTAQPVTATWAGADAARTLTITYVSQDGHTHTGTIAGANGAASNSTVFAVSVSAVSIDDDSAGAVEVGFVAANGAVTQSIPVNRRQSPFNMSLFFDLTAGTMTLSAQYSEDPPNNPAITYANGYAADAIWRDVAGLTDVTADDNSNLAFPVESVRFIQTVGSATGTCTVTVIQGQNA